MGKSSSVYGVWLGVEVVTGWGSEVGTPIYASAGCMLLLERLLYWQPADPDPLYRRGDLVDRPRGMSV